MTRNKKLILVTNIPNQYRIPLFNELNRQLKKMGWELFVIFGAENSRRRKANIDMKECAFDYTFLKPGMFSFIEKQSGFLFYSGLLSLISKEKPEQVIVSGFSMSTVKLWFKSLLSRISFHIISGSTESASQHGIARKFIRKVLAKRARGFIAYGSLAKEYLMNLGISESQIVPMGNTVDTTFFQSRTEDLRKRQENRASNHLTYVGYINKRKNVAELIWVLKDLLKLRGDVVLDLVGDGEELESLKALVEKEKLTPFVTFHGFVQKEELPEIMAQSDLFLFQTDSDIWGLVLNEAMAAGIPCLASVNSGAAYDLIEEGETGFVVNFKNHSSVAKKIDTLLNNPNDLKRIGENASSLVNTQYSLSASARRITKVLSS